MVEKLIRWDPPEHLASRRYHPISIFFDSRKLSLSLEEYSGPRKMCIEFHDLVYDFRLANESYRYKTFDYFFENYRTELEKTFFFIVVNSLYVQEFLKRSGTFVGDYPKNLRHFIFFGTNEIIDIITATEPVFREIKR